MRPQHNAGAPVKVSDSWPSTQGEGGWWVVGSKRALELGGQGQGQAACRGRHKHLSSLATGVLVMS